MGWQTVLEERTRTLENTDKMETWFSVRTREHFLTTSFARASSGPCAGLEGAPWASAAPPDLGLAVQTYDIQGSLQKHSQVTVSIVLENQGHSVLKNMELNVLDSLNTKLARPEGSSVHDGVPVPFQLPPGEPAVTSRAWWRPGATEGWSSSSHLLASVPGSWHPLLGPWHNTSQAPLSVPPSPGISNEAQFVFTIQSIVMAQKLKGTLSFIAKVHRA